MAGQRDLEVIGFELIGRWQFQDNDPQCVMHRLSDAAPALYAFTIGGEVMYVGKTVRTLKRRLYDYEKGSGTQRTNIRVRDAIRQALRQGRKVDILGFHDPKPQRLGKFVVNLPAALEDDIIRVLNPPWNGVRNTRRWSGKKPVLSEEDRQHAERREASITPATNECDPEGVATVPAFVVTVGQTYFRQGFFNVPRAHTHRFPTDGGLIEIRLPRCDTPLRAVVNRRANVNGTPRIMGGTGLRNWFQKTTRVGGSIRVRVQSSDLIDIAPV